MKSIWNLVCGGNAGSTIVTDLQYGESIDTGSLSPSSPQPTDMREVRCDLSDTLNETNTPTTLFHTPIEHCFPRSTTSISSDQSSSFSDSHPLCSSRSSLTGSDTPNSLPINRPPQVQMSFSKSLNMSRYRYELKSRSLSASETIDSIPSEQELADLRAKFASLAAQQTLRQCSPSQSNSIDDARVVDQQGSDHSLFEVKEEAVTASSNESCADPKLAWFSMDATHHTNASDSGSPPAATNFHPADSSTPASITSTPLTSRWPNAGSAEVKQFISSSVVLDNHETKQNDASDDSEAVGSDECAIETGSELSARSSDFGNAICSITTLLPDENTAFSANDPAGSSIQAIEQITLVASTSPAAVSPLSTQSFVVLDDFQTRRLKADIMAQVKTLVRETVEAALPSKNSVAARLLARDKKAERIADLSLVVKGEVHNAQVKILDTLRLSGRESTSSTIKAAQKVMEHCTSDKDALLEHIDRRFAELDVRLKRLKIRSGSPRVETMPLLRSVQGQQQEQNPPQQNPAQQAISSIDAEVSPHSSNGSPSPENDQPTITQTDPATFQRLLDMSAHMSQLASTTAKEATNALNDSLTRIESNLALLHDQQSATAAPTTTTTATATTRADKFSSGIESEAINSLLTINQETTSLLAQVLTQSTAQNNATNQMTSLLLPLVGRIRSMDYNLGMIDAKIATLSRGRELERERERELERRIAVVQESLDADNGTSPKKKIQDENDGGSGAEPGTTAAEEAECEIEREKERERPAKRKKRVHHGE